MPRQRRHYAPEQKVALLRLHLLEKKPVSDICQENNLSVNLFYPTFRGTTVGISVEFSGQQPFRGRG